MAATNPTAPLFVPSLAELQSKLRLGGLPDEADSVEILNEGIQTARVAFFRRLGSGTLDSLAAVSYAAEPSTNDEYLRLVAANTEVLLVRVFLMRTMPVLFRDSSGDALQSWNDEGVIREAPEGLDLDTLIRSLEDQISENMELLAGEESAGAETSIKVSTIGPSTAPPRPGETVYNYPDPA